MRVLSTTLFSFALLVSASSTPIRDSASSSNASMFGFRNSSAENATEALFLAVPDPKLAEEHLRILTKAPHMAGTPEDKTTADYVTQKFRGAGLETDIVEYKAWFNYPQEISVDITAPAGVEMHGPTREHVDADPYDDDPRVVMPFNSMSPSGDLEADVIYANYGTPDDFDKLAQMNIDVRGKIVLVRYGQNFRGVKVFVAQERGAAGVIIYSDPYDDGWRRGDKYPVGPWRPDTGVQRGSVGYMFEFPGDPTTPGIASLPSLPESKRISPEQSAQMPKIPATPLSYHDAWPILQNLGGPDSPRDWQGSLPFTYHVGPGPVRVKMHLKQDYQFRPLWDVIGRIPGSDAPQEQEWVVAGNHRDAWVYGAVDPNSGTAAMLETVHGIGELLKSGWKPKRTMIFASWDGEEEGLMGSTEWAEDHEAELAKAPAYFNMDVGVSGTKFGASAVPSLKQFLRDIAKAVPSPKGGTVYEAWQKADQTGSGSPQSAAESDSRRRPAATAENDVRVGDLGSGSDYSSFQQHLGVPSTDIGSTGPYGVYHSTFDDFTWFKKFADPDFVYEQQMARVFGLEMLRMADADVLPYDYEEYGKEVATYIDAAAKRAESKLGPHALDFDRAATAARHFQEAGAKVLAREKNPPRDAERLNQALLGAERALLVPEGLPHRPWFRHAIYAPGEYTGYAAVVIPGVNEAIDKGDAARAREQLAVLTAALERAAKDLQGYK
ncbi:MAG: M28 family metallopeptidase [Candidatus Sulfotelmatobacter sp.]